MINDDEEKEIISLLEEKRDGKLFHKVTGYISTLDSYIYKLEKENQHLTKDLKESIAERSILLNEIHKIGFEISEYDFESQQELQKFKEIILNEEEALKIVDGPKGLKEIDNYIIQLKQENQRLEEQDRNNTATLVLLNDENKELKDNVEYLRGLITNKIMSSYEYESVLKDEFNALELKYIASTESRNDLEMKLKQRDEVIDEVMEKIELLREMIPGYSAYNKKDLQILISDILDYTGDNK